MFGLAIRSLVEAARVAAGTHERQVKQASFADAGFELFDLPVKAAKAYPKPRDVSKVDLVVVHVTAVRGGFGVSKSAVAKWTKQIRDGFPTTPPSIVGQLPILDLDADVTLAARRLALWERFRDVPYHGIACRNGDVLSNHPLSRHSWHGNAGNVGVGWAIDAAPDEQLDDWMVETGRTGLRILIDRLRRETSMPVIRVAPHRAFSASRRNDTGPMVWGRIVEPVIALYEGRVVADYDLKKDGGATVPSNWRAA